MGFRAGLVATLYSLASWILATAAAIAFAGPVSSVVETFARLPRPVAARQLFDLVNEERGRAGLAVLAWDERLVPVARAHSEEMFKLKYFSHESPIAGSPFDRLKAAGITYARAGENLAYAQSVAVAHRALMDSPGHRENILRPEFTRIGIGVISAGAYGRMVTQLFITP